MEKSTKIIGVVAFGLMAYFLFKSKDENENSAPIEGLNISVNPDKIVDSLMPFIDMPPQYKGTLQRGLKRAINGYMAGKKEQE